MGETYSEIHLLQNTLILIMLSKKTSRAYRLKNASRTIIIPTGKTR